MDDVLNLQNLIQDSIIISQSDNRMVLANESYRAVVRLSWDSKKKTWLMTSYDERKSGSPINTTVNDEPPTGGSGFRPPLTTKNNVDSPANNFNDFFTDSSRQTNDAQTLADQQAHLQRSQQEINSFREQQLKQLYRSFEQQRTEITPAPHAPIVLSSPKKTGC